MSSSYGARLCPEDQPQRVAVREASGPATVLRLVCDTAALHSLRDAEGFYGAHPTSGEIGNEQRRKIPKDLGRTKIDIRIFYIFVLPKSLGFENLVWWTRSAAIVPSR
jgi:hypothetical protein